MVNTPTGSHNPVQVADDVAILSGRQAAEYMLCRDCEKLIAERERYVSTIAVDATGAFPALTQTRAVYVHDAEWQVADASALNCDALAYFAASVIWRASVSALFKSVTLGSYDVAFADYLLGRAPFPKDAMLLVELMQPANGPRIDRVIIEPESQRSVGYHVHNFAVFGMRFRLMVGRVLPQAVRPFSFVDKKVVLISRGAELLAAVSAKAKTATAKGSLARRQ